MNSNSPIEGNWEFITKMRITSRAVACVDPMSWDAVHVDLDNGIYAASILIVQYEQEPSPRVARVVFTRATKYTVGKKIDTIGVDAATLGILDAKALASQVAKETAEYKEQLNSSWRSTEISGTVNWGSGEDDIMVHVSTGFGDGTYPIRELLQDGKRVGFDIEFIKPGAHRPF